MTWYLIVLVTIVALVLLTLVVDAALTRVDDEESERLRIEMEMRLAERRLHDIARNGFARMLDEARRNRPT